MLGPGAIHWGSSVRTMSILTMALPTKVAGSLCRAVRFWTLAGILGARHMNVPTALTFAETVSNVGYNRSTAFPLPPRMPRFSMQVTGCLIVAISAVSDVITWQSIGDPIFALLVSCLIGIALMKMTVDAKTTQSVTAIQKLKTFSAALTIMGCVGFLIVLLGSWFLPLV
jgi:hypothetical protein